jgi:glycosyltransferase involved in cell wall biosynthesis
MAFQSGIWWHRVEQPMRAMSKRGHAIAQTIIRPQLTEQELSFPDVVIFARTYPPAYQPLALMKEFKKRGKRVLYDMDDDFWQVAKDNPSVLVSNAFKDQYESLIKEADAIITPSRILVKKFKRLIGKKPIYICPNGIDYAEYKERPHKRNELVIGYMGATSHWKDLQIIIEALSELYQKYDFSFDVYGMCSEPIESAMYMYGKYLQGQFEPEKNEYFRAALKFYDGMKQLHGRHTPFMPPELHPTVMGRVDFDIGIAPLEDTEFNRGKSCIKFYEYASVGTVTLASDVLPYKDEVNYRAKNTKKDWYNKLEKLIVDEKFRKSLLEKQQTWVKENRSLEEIGVIWEKACQKEGGLKVLNQQK